MGFSRYGGLAHIDSVTRFDAETDGDCLVDLAEVLWDHGLANRYIVTLLHTHFAINANEVLTSTCDSKAREIWIDTAPLAAVKRHGLIPVSWRLSRSGRAIALQFSPRDDHQLVSPREQASLFADASRVLERRSCLNRFGLALANEGVKAKRTETLLENTDVDARVQWLEPVRRSSVNFKKVVVTTWRFRERVPVEVSRCRIKNDSYCTRHCETYCNEMNSGHKSRPHKARHSKTRNSVHYES